MYLKVVISSFLLFAAQTTVASLAQNAQTLNALIAKAEQNSALVTSSFVTQYKTALQSYKKAVAQDKSKTSKFKEWLPTYQSWDDHFMQLAQVNQQKAAAKSQSNNAAPKKTQGASVPQSGLPVSSASAQQSAEEDQENDVDAEQEGGQDDEQDSQKSVPTNQPAQKSVPQSTKSVVPVAVPTSSASSFKQRKGIRLFDIVENPQAHEFQVAAFETLAQVTQTVQEYVKEQLLAQAQLFSDSVTQAMNGKQEEFSASLQQALQTFDVAVHGTSGGGGVLSVARQIYQQLMFGGTNPNIVEQAQSGHIQNGTTFVSGSYAAGVGSYDPFGNLLLANIQSLIDQAYAEMNAVVQLLLLQVALPTVAVQASNNLVYYRQMLEDAANEPTLDTSSWWKGIQQSAKSFGSYVKSHFQDLFAGAVAKVTNDALEDVVWSLHDSE